jgi:hypothetical protein
MVASAAHPSRHLPEAEKKSHRPASVGTVAYERVEQRNLHKSKASIKLGKSPHLFSYL